MGRSEESRNMLGSAAAAPPAYCNPQTATPPPRDSRSPAAVAVPWQSDRRSQNTAVGPLLRHPGFGGPRTA